MTIHRRPRAAALLLAILSLLLSAGPGLAQSPVEMPDRIVGLLEWTEDNERFEYRLELFPIFVYRKGGYLQGETIDCAVAPESAAVESGQEYGVYSHGSAIGRFVVDEVLASRRACCPVRVGVGRLGLDPSEKRNLSVKEPLLAVFPPLKSASPSERLWSQAGLDPEKFIQSVTPALNTLMDSYIQEEEWGPLKRGPLEIERRTPYALDGGRTIAVATEASVVLSPRTEGSARRERPVTARLVVWFAVPEEGRPEALVRIRYLQPGFDPAGRDAGRLWLIDVIDIDGDGRSEMVYRVEGHQSRRFRVYSPASDRDRPVFDGAGTGC